MSNPMPGSPGFPYQPPTAPKSGGTSVVKIVLIVMVVLGLACACCGGIIYYVINAGIGEVKNQAAAAASQNQVVKDNLGDLEAADLSMNLVATGQSKEKYGRDCIVFNADGPLGKGQLVFETGGSSQGIGRLIVVEVDGESIKIE